MGFEFIAFGAATVPLSKIVIDKELDMTPYPIKAQYRPEEWATEEVGWGDTAPSDYSPEVEWAAKGGDYELFTNSGPGAKYRVKVRVGTTTYAVASITVKVNGVTAASNSSGLGLGETYVSPAFGVETGQTVVLTITSTSANGSRVHMSYQCTGEVWGAKTFDLTGKWLAVGIDMKGLAPTVKVQGVEMPYSEYVKAFPLAPSELTFPSGWDPSVERPVVRVYK